MQDRQYKTYLHNFTKNISTITLITTPTPMRTSILRSRMVHTVGAVVSHNAVIADGCHVDCNATVTARSIVKTKNKIESGQVYKRGGTGKEKVKNI